MAEASSLQVPHGGQETLIDPHSPNNFAIKLGQALLERPSPDGKYYSVKYNHRPKRIKISCVPKITQKTKSCSLSLESNDGIEYTYTGRRQNNPQTSYLLKFDKSSQTCTIDPLDTSYLFNVGTKKTEAGSEDISNRYPKLPLTEEDQSPDTNHLQVNGATEPRSRAGSQSAVSSDAELFGDELEGDDISSNPFDYRNYINGLPPPLDDQKSGLSASQILQPSPSRPTSTASTPLRPSTPSHGPAPVETPTTRKLGSKRTLVLSQDDSTRDKAQNKPSKKEKPTAASRKVLKNIMKPSPSARTRKENAEKRLKPVEDESPTSRTLLPEVHLPPESPSRKRRRPVDTPTAVSSDNELVIDLGDEPAEDRIAIARREREARKKANLLGTPRSGALGPISLHSAAVSAGASPMYGGLNNKPGTGRFANRAGGSNLKGRSQRENSDIEEIDLGSPKHNVVSASQRRSSSVVEDADADVEDEDEDQDDEEEDEEALDAEALTAALEQQLTEGKDQRKDSFSRAFDDAIEGDKRAREQSNAGGGQSDSEESEEE